MSPGVFTLAEFHRRTPGRTGEEKLAVFGELPERLGREAWDDLAEAMTYRTERDFEELGCSHDG